MVYLETVEKGKEKGLLDAYLIEKNVNNGKIQIIIVKEKYKKDIEKLYGITKGENETICLSLQKNAKLILSDDKKCINTCKTLGFKFAISADVVVALYTKKRITKDKAIEALNKLENIGWLKKEIIESRKKECK